MVTPADAPRPPEPIVGSPTTRLVAAAAAGQAVALESLARRLRPVLAVMARHRFPPALSASHDPEDLIQDVWLIALRRLGDLRARDGRLTPVLIRFLRRTMALHVRTLLRREIARRSRRGDPAPDEPVDLGGSRDVISRVAIREAGRALAGQIDGLPEPQRSIVVLRAIEQHPNHEVARRLGLRPNTVSKTYARALAQLRSAWPDSVLAEFSAQSVTRPRGADPLST